MGTTGLFDFKDSFNSSFFVGREAELSYLETRLIKEKRRVGLITGKNAVGKTTMVHIFLNRFFKERSDEVEFIGYFSHRYDLPQLTDHTRLVVIDDLSYDISGDTLDRILKYIDQNPNKQFLLISPFEDQFLNKHINYKITLQNFREDESLQILTNTLQKKIGHQEALKLIAQTQGNPYLIKLISYYLNDPYHLYTVNDILKMISDNISVSGIIDLNGKPIATGSREFGQIVSDIKIFNNSILSKIKMNPSEMYRLKPREFEEFIAELMLKQGYVVDLTQVTRDGGKDLIMARHGDIGNFIYYVECKQYQPKNPVGVQLVRQLAGTILADQVTAGIMITSSYFSSDAIQYSQKLKHQLSLVDYVKLKQWLHLL